MTRIRLPYVNEYRDVRGKLRRYFRKGHQRVPLSGLPGSDEFMAAYQAALAGVETKPAAISAKPGTVSAAIVGYYRSQAFQECAESTKQMRRRILERFRDDNGKNRLHLLEQRHIIKLLGQLKSYARRNWLKTLRAFLEFAVAEGFLSNNPATGIKTKVPKSDGIHTWSEEEVAQFETYWPIGSKPRLAMAISLYTALRLSDAIRIGPQHIRHGVLHVTQRKTGARLQLPVRPELRAIIDGTQVGNLTFLVNKHGAPYTDNYFVHEFRKWCNEAGLPNCSYHGLRKTCATRLANAGARAHGIAAVTGP